MRWPAASPGPSWVAGRRRSPGAKLAARPEGLRSPARGAPPGCVSLPTQRAAKQRPVPDHPQGGRRGVGSYCRFPPSSTRQHSAPAVGRCGTGCGTSLGCNKAGQGWLCRAGVVRLILHAIAAKQASHDTPVISRRDARLSVLHPATAWRGVAPTPLA